MAKRTPSLNAPLLRSRFKLRSLQSHSVLASHHPHLVAQLESAGIHPGKLRLHAAKAIASGAAAVSLLLSPHFFTLGTQPHLRSQVSLSRDLSLSQANLISGLSEVLPVEVRPLLPPESATVSRLLADTYGISASTELEGNRLNTDYGYIGAEQHLPRFPGDTVDQHDTLHRSGITPGRGAWGYFAPSAAELTPELAQIEKYYVAVQTLYLPDWSTRLAYLRDWYKYRRMVVVNPKNGRVIVAAVADSGPAWWTGKSFGGSPEVMDYLQSKDGRQKGPVIMFFLNDPEGRIPLGPVEYNQTQLPAVIPS